MTDPTPVPTPVPAPVAKPWYLSKTMWVGMLTIVVGVLQWVLGQLQGGYAITVIGLLVVILRLVTHQPISQG